MKKILVLGCLVLVIILSGCGGAYVGCGGAYVDPDGVIKVGIGEKFTLALDADPAAGYQWFASFDTTRLEMVDSWYEDRKVRGLTGDGGTRFLRFMATRSGNVEIELLCMKPEEGPQPGDPRREFRVDIR